MKQRKTYVAIAAFLALAFAGAALAGVMTHTSRKAVRITVVEREYSLTVKHALAAGPTTFVVVNRGHVAHSLAISGPGLKKQLVGLDSPGKTKLLTVTLKAGTYRLWCPVPGHAALGMKANVRVGSATSSQATTTGHTGGWG